MSATSGLPINAAATVEQRLAAIEAALRGGPPVVNALGVVTDGAVDLGAAMNKWRDIFATGLVVGNQRVDLTGLANTSALRFFLANQANWQWPYTQSNALCLMVSGTGPTGGETTFQVVGGASLRSGRYQNPAPPSSNVFFNQRLQMGRLTGLTAASRLNVNIGAAGPSVIWLADSSVSRAPYYSFDNGVSWSNAGVSSVSSQTTLSGISVSPSGPLWVSGDSPDRIYRSSNGGRDWENVGPAPSGQSSSQGLAVAPNGDLWFAGNSPDRVYKSTDDGANWSAPINGPAGQSSIFGIDVAPNGDLWLIGSTPDRIYKSTDEGANWSAPIAIPSAITLPGGIAVAPNGDILIVSWNNDYLYRSTDDGVTWDAGTDINPPSQNPYGLGVDPRTPQAGFGIIVPY